eukprot:5088846-Pleurochrysis_carterae.AAC.1
MSSVASRSTSGVGKPCAQSCVSSHVYACGIGAHGCRPCFEFCTITFCVRCPAWRAISLPPAFKLCELLRAAARRTVNNPVFYTQHASARGSAAHCRRPCLHALHASACGGAAHNRRPCPHTLHSFACSSAAHSCRPCL